MSKLDITPELALGAFNILIQYTKQIENCRECVLEGKPCDMIGVCPGKEWEEMLPVMKAVRKEMKAVRKDGEPCTKTG